MDGLQNWIAAYAVLILAMLLPFMLYAVLWIVVRMDNHEAAH